MLLSLSSLPLLLLEQLEPAPHLQAPKRGPRRRNAGDDPPVPVPVVPVRVRDEPGRSNQREVGNADDAGGGKGVCPDLALGVPGRLRALGLDLLCLLLRLLLGLGEVALDVLLGLLVVSARDLIELLSGGLVELCALLLGGGLVLACLLLRLVLELCGVLLELGALVLGGSLELGALGLGRLLRLPSLLLGRGSLLLGGGLGRGQGVRLDLVRKERSVAPLRAGPSLCLVELELLEVVGLRGLLRVDRGTELSGRLGVNNCGE